MFPGNGTQGDRQMAAETTAHRFVHHADPDRVEV
jgi:hypothetical protein